MPSDPRRGRAYQAARRLLLRHRPQPCWICGHGIDYDADPRTPRAPSADHLQELALGGHPIDPANLAVAHVGCNSSRGARLGNTLRQQRQAPTTDPGPSRDW